MRRSDQRRAAVVALYQHDVTGRSLEEVLPRDAKPFTRALIGQVVAYREELDTLIARHLKGWTLDRLAPLDLNIMRVATLELKHKKDLPGERDVPPEVAIDEAIELAKELCGSDAPAFINGVLDAILDEIRDNGVHESRDNS